MKILKFRAWDEDNEEFIYWSVGEIDLSFWHEVRVHGWEVEQYI